MLKTWHVKIRNRKITKYIGKNYITKRVNKLIFIVGIPALNYSILIVLGLVYISSSTSKVIYRGFCIQKYL